MLNDNLTSDPAKILAAGVVAHVTMPPAVSITGTILNYALPLIYAVLSHCIINLFRNKTNGTTPTQNQNN